MFKQKLQISKKIDSALPFLLIAILIGGYIRISPVLDSDFPLNDGGMFYVMIKDLIANHFQIPLFTSYNSLNIPYAYPPLGFYFAAFLNSFLKIEILDILRFVPATFATLSILAFYLLAKEIINDHFQLILAVLIFSFMPASFDWIIMGGGISRAMAFFFSLIDLYFILRLFRSEGKLNILWVALFSSLVILSHPESALHTAAGALAFFLIFGRNKKGILKSALVVGLILLFTLPWWGTVLSKFGFEPFITAGKTGFHRITQLSRLFHFDFTGEYGVKISGALSLVGLFWYLQKKQFFIPVWVLINFLSEPRSATLYLTPAIALLASFALVNIFTWMGESGISESDPKKDTPIKGAAMAVLFLVLFGQWIYSAFTTTLMLSSNTLLSQEDRTAYKWIAQNTPADSRFLVISGKSPLTDQISEWFPALTGRQSVATVQGYEWLSDYNFDTVLEQAQSVQNCYFQDYSCITNWLKYTNKTAEYIYLHNPSFTEGASGQTKYQYSTMNFYDKQNSLVEIYHQGSVVIYRIPESSN
ncbi:hypothetical protein SDC9_66969 [bioreactor metagenome]|uniref:Uncharacterized protein n=1 Tax=bioreactor metagenome TaxID=1076179 RepID=A0A644XXL7_9ZZZZ